MQWHVVNNIYVARFIHDRFPYDQRWIGALNGLMDFIVSNFDKSNIVDFKYGNIHIENGWYLHLQKTYDHQNWKAGTSKEVDSSETNPSATGHVTYTWKTLQLPLNNGYDHQIETARLLGDIN